MQIVQKDAPAVASQSSPSTTTQEQNAAKNARDRAIAAMLGNGAPVQPTSPSDLVNAQPPVIKEESQEASANPAESQGDTSTSEASPPAAAPVKEPALSSQYAQLARKEKALRAQQLELKSQQAKIQAMEAEFKAKSAQTPAEPDKSKYITIDELKANPWDVLQRTGLTYEQLTQQALSAPSPQEQQMVSEIQALKNELKALRTGHDETRKAMEEQQTTAYKQAVSQIRSDVKKLVDSDANFEMTSATDSVSDVVELIEKTFKEDGVLLSVEEAAQAVEDHLLEEATRLAKLKKVQSRLSAAPATPSKPAQKQSPNPAAPVQTKTLSNNMGSSRPLSARERALLAFKGELGK
jgi:hypothetical protein